jgi:menaquinone-9 beta-reductase
MIMKSEREVIIAGAGPAGAFTAALLAAQKHDVLLLDKEQFPREKICGDAVSADVLELLIIAGMEEKIRTAFNRGNFYPLHYMRLISPHGYQKTYPLSRSANEFSACVVPRIYFDSLIQQQAIEAGAEFHQAKVKAPLIENNRVVGVKICDAHGVSKEIRSEIVVGADGVASTLAHALRKGHQRSYTHRAIALRAYAENIELYPNEVEFFIYEGILPGYAWIFPVGENRANIGLGMRLDHYHRKPRNLKAMLDQFLKLPLVNKRLKKDFKLENIATWPLNFGSQKNLQYSFDGAMLVGDAGGFISPLTGGGIHRSLLSGQLAAEIIHDALQKGDTSLTGLKPYEIRCRNQLLKSLRQTYYLTNLLLRFPFLVDIFVNRCKKENPLTRIIIK